MIYLMDYSFTPSRVGNNVLNMKFSILRHFDFIPLLKRSRVNNIPIIMRCLQIAELEHYHRALL